MAHTCPECGQACYCNGDIDDCLNQFEDDVNNCVHYLSPSCQNGEDDYEPGDYDDETT